MLLFFYFSVDAAYDDGSVAVVVVVAAAAADISLISLSLSKKLHFIANKFDGIGSCTWPEKNVIVRSK